MGDSIVPLQHVPRGVRPAYVILMILCSVGVAGTSTWVAVRTLTPTVAKADAQAETATEELKKARTDAERAVAELKKAKAEADKADEDLKRKTAEAEKLKIEIQTSQINLRTAQSNEKVAEESAKQVELRNRQLAADIAAEAKRRERQEKGYDEKVAFLEKELIRLTAENELSRRDLADARKQPRPEPPKPKPPADPTELRANSTATVRGVIGPGVLYAEATGDAAAEKFNAFDTGEKVTVLAVA